MGSGLPGLAHLLELRLKLRTDPKIVASGPLVSELRHLQRGHFGGVHGAAAVLDAILIRTVPFTVLVQSVLRSTAVSVQI
eukprot:SAG11_NODE_1841_length_4182_cov_4.130541_7_plen_80_part_00